MCHKCDNPPCVNPAHLYAGTQLDNTKDMLVRERLGKVAKLSISKVRNIKRRLGRGELQRVIAARFNVSQSTISYISRGKTWQHASV